MSVPEELKARRELRKIRKELQYIISEMKKLKTEIYGEWGPKKNV